jgi:uncharacterized protein
MRVLITGVTGHMGSHLCAELADAGYEGVGTSCNPGRASVRGLTRAYRWSGAGELLPAQAIEGMDAIINLVGENPFGRWTKAKKRRMYDSRVESTRNIVRGIEASGHAPSLLVSSSACGRPGAKSSSPRPRDAAPAS